MKIVIHKSCVHLRLSAVFLFFFCALSLHAFDQVVIWGHKLHSHTHSYVHEGFFRAFQHLGYSTYWLDQNDDLSGFDFSNTLFLTEGQVDANIPLQSDCFYILHNPISEKYKSLPHITLQVYTDDVLTRPGLVNIAPCIYFDIPGKCLYMPWATDLLPHEIDKMKQTVTDDKEQTIYWIGTFGDGIFGNKSELEPFIHACEENNIAFKQVGGISRDEHINLIKKSFFAPAIAGAWQKQSGYIPCRIFKNISYGQYGVTNSLRVYELFQNKIVYNPDTYLLFYNAKKEVPLEKLFEQMDFVRDHHTYINRIQTILDFIKVVEKVK